MNARVGERGQLGVINELREILDTLRDAWTIAAKDVRLEMRSKEILLTMGYFGFLVVLIFAFAFFRGDAPIGAVAAGITWVAIAFAGTLGLGRAFDREREGDCIRALLLSPVPRSAIYIGKTLSVIASMFIIELIVVPSVMFFFSISLDLPRLSRLCSILALGTVGYAVVGALLAAMMLHARSKDVLLSIVLYPFVLPVIIGGVKATSGLFEPIAAYEELEIWMKLLLVFDMVFLVASLWIFERIILD